MNNLPFRQLFKCYKESFFEFNYLFFSITLVIGLSTGEIIMSISSIALFINWLVEGRLKEKHKNIKRLNYIPYLLMGGYFSLFLWLINTSNFDYAFNDLRVKLPLLLFPLILGSIKISTGHLLIIFRFFILGLLFSTLISFFVYLELIPIEKNLQDIRSISIFISHIRLSLFICFAIVLLVFYLFIKKTLFSIYFSLGLMIWFIYFLFILQAFTGLFILGALIIISLFHFLFKKRNKRYVAIAIALFTLFFIAANYHVYDIYKQSFTPKIIELEDLDIKSQAGEIYQHRLEDNWLENGYRVWLYIAPNELEKAWGKRSKISLSSKDAKGQPIWGTLYRYLTSKGLRKDKKGLSELTDSEIVLVEMGETNCCEKLTGIDKRIKDVLFQFRRYQNGQSPNGHSIIQRVEYIKASIGLIKSNLFFGVGLGDVHDEFMNHYEVNNSKILGKNRKRVHNQYMVFAVGIGVVGLIFWVWIFYFPFLKLEWNREIYFYFLVIISISFLTDNTLERQAGVMFFAFFNSLFLFQKPQRGL